MGTIILKDDTKTKLIKVTADLQKKSGVRVDFDGTISYLIDPYFNQEKDWDKFELFCKTTENVTSEELLEELRKGRKEDEKKFNIDFFLL
ncbi:MAG: hypothetical protein ACTSRI_19160 [Promethearchaeota archaeon]